MLCLVWTWWGISDKRNRPLNQLTALLGFDEVIVTPLSTSSGLVQRSCSSILLLFKSNIWGGQECCSSILYYISNSNIWGAKCSSYIIYSIQHVSDWITCNSHSIGCFYFLLPCCGSNILYYIITSFGNYRPKAIANNRTSGLIASVYSGQLIDVVSLNTRRCISASAPSWLQAVSLRLNAWVLISVRR